MEKNYNNKLTLAYDGTAYHGWQIQPNGISVQEILQNTLNIITREQVKVTGSGRTDTGVHALAQVAHFKTNHSLDLYKLLGSLNALLPIDIRILKAEPAPLNFHAQHSAKGKIYHYFLHLDRAPNPFNRLYSARLFEPLEITLFYEAAKHFIGTHDFTSFANESHSGVAAHDPIRTLKRLDIFPIDGGLRFELEADGFLYKMVRNIVGTLIDVATHKIELNSIPLIFEAKDRRQAGRSAPAQGLFLVHVHY